MRTRSKPAHDRKTLTACYLRALMNDTWSLSRHAARHFGGTPAEYVREGLRQTWQQTKANPGAWQTAALMADFESR